MMMANVQYGKNKRVILNQEIKILRDGKHFKQEFRTPNRRSMKKKEDNLVVRIHAIWNPYSIFI